ncbi:RHS repeat-associated core domain-containing protein [uncultured Victivallis sp.]|uniref:RHS repeat-associated core domain-containing protein n=1 Tax=uncultured Victivallis sp. TaxID=354118 RepID=UPI0025984D4E|nr:RHS repeat-associated core domain-containing protein [uncultured Victivallis sp.]
MVLTQTVNGQTTSFEYDNMGRQTKVTAPGNVVTNTAYYPTGEIRRIDGATYPVEYTYNNLGNQATMTTFKDADTPQQTSWSYNSRGQMTAKTYADNSSVTYTYNGDGQLLTRTWARQANGAPLVTSYTYDAAGRQTGYSYSDGTTPAVTQTLNFLDQPVTVTDAAGTRNFTYNADHRLVNETIPSIVNGMINYTYDAYGRRTVMNFGNGTTSFANAAYSYDSAGRIATVGNSADTLTYTYMPGTNIVGSSAWQTATLNTVNTYDSYKRLTNIAVNGVNVYGYTLNDKNQRTGATLPDGNTWSYDYDAMGQLTGAVKQSSGNTQLAGMSWFYDQIGNRTSATENNVTTSYISNLVNQYTQIASQFPTYDADGNMLTYNGWTFTWNGENRLIAAESSDTRLEFSYDYMGRRLEKKVYTKGLFTLYNWSLVKHHKFVYDGYKLMAEFDALNDDAQVASYLWQPVGLDVPLMRTIDGVNGYYVADGNKNILAVRDSNGTDLSNYTYTPFGTVENPEDSDDNPFRFSSEYCDDETGLVYYNYRYYSPELGRWIKRDPIEEEGGVNLYGYVANSPIDRFDYLGMAWNISRTGKAWAIAMRSSLDKDNIERLASLVCLDDNEAIKWLRNVNGTVVTENDLKQGRCFKVPNTIAVYTSKPKVGDGIITFVAKLRRNAISMGQSYKGKGYNLVEHKSAESNSLFVSLWQLDGIAAIVFAGHGSEYGFASDNGSGTSANEVSPPYKLQRVDALHCYSAATHIRSTRKEDNKGWRDWVSKDGSYEVYTKAVHHLNEESARVRKNHYRIP